MQKGIAAIRVFLSGLVVAGSARAANERVRLKIIFSSFTGAYTALWLAVEERIGTEVRIGVRSGVRRLVLVVFDDDDFQAAGVDPQEVVDMSFVKQVESSAAVK